MQTHLDRCLTCLNCETTCPSGVQYRHLLEIGRTVVDRQLGRSRLDRLARRGLRILLTTPQLFAVALKTGRWFAPMLPKKLRLKIPASKFPVPARRRGTIAKSCWWKAVCRQSPPPRTNAAAARVLDRLGITAVSVAGETCCGAASLHLGGSAEARRLARKNIDAWAATLEEGAEAIVSTASGCGVMIKDYAHLLADDADYADKAARVVAATRDLGEVIADEDLSALKIEAEKRIAFQSPCSLQHGQKLSGKIESILSRLGFELTPVNDSHLCCGSAGTYSILQPTMAATLRQRKLDNLCRHQPQVIATANIGCHFIWRGTFRSGTGWNCSTRTSPPKAMKRPDFEVYHGDNLPILKTFPDSRFSLIYIDPPFNTGKVQSRTKINTIRDDNGDRTGFQGRRYRTLRQETKSYDDVFDNHQAFLEPRLREARRILSATGSLFFHIDYREAHGCKLLLDDIFGSDSFMNEIIWAYDYGARSKKKMAAETRHPFLVREGSEKLCVQP